MKQNAGSLTLLIVRLLMCYSFYMNDFEFQAIDDFEYLQTPDAKWQYGCKLFLIFVFFVGGMLWGVAKIITAVAKIGAL